MAQPFPQDPMDGRHPEIEGDLAVTDKDLPEPAPEDEDEEYIEQPDGSMIIRKKKREPVLVYEFYANLADGYLPADYADRVALDLIEKAKKDKEARKGRDQQQEEGIRRTGLGKDAPGGAGFEGASKAVHPGLTKACIDFASRAIKELYPPSGPVKMKINGKSTPERAARADRKTLHMNWQLTEEVKEYRTELHQTLTQVPIGGSQYMKAWYDPSLMRNRVEFIPVDVVHIPYAASSFYSAQRRTIEVKLTEVTYKDRIRNEMYRDVDNQLERADDEGGREMGADGRLNRPSQEPERTKSEEANEKIEGKAPTGYNDDGQRLVWEVYVVMECPHDKEVTKHRAVPYIISIDDHTSKVLSWRRNWEEDDEAYQEMDWVVEFSLIPWRGAYAIGLPHIIGSLSAAQTGAVRALLDSAHINNIPTLLKLKGGKIGGQSKSINPTGVVEVEGGINTTDVRQVAMPVPFNPPSTVLFQLLGYLDGQMEGAVRTSLDNSAIDTSTAVPVGTQLSRVEQGLMVFSSIFSNLHASQARFMRVFHRLNKMYLPRRVKFGDETVVFRKDYQSDMDVGPVSDPNVFSEAQRFAQLQGVGALISLFPQKFNIDKYLDRNLKLMKIPDPDELLAKPPDPEEMNPVLENARMMTGGPVAAFPDQDQLAHLQVHLSFMDHPMLGSNVIIAPTFIPACLEHIKQHLSMWYVQRTVKLVEEHTGMSMKELMDPDPELRVKFDQMMAVASLHVMDQANSELSKIPAVIQKAMQLLQQFAPKPPPDPMAEVAASEVARKTSQDQAANADKHTRQQLSAAAEERKKEKDRSDAEIAARELATREMEASIAAQARLRSQQMGDETREHVSEEDNRTAMDIAVLSAETDRRTRLRDGDSIARD